MRLIATNSALEGGKLIFLDTADWSYLESGQDPEATAALRSLAKARNLRFLVTLDHLVEIAGLTDGRSDRLAFLQAFPGTVLICAGGTQVIRLAAAAFAAAVFGGEVAPYAVPCSAMDSEPIEQLLSRTRQLLPLRLAHGLHATVTARTNRETASLPKRKQEREAEQKLHRLARKGDIRAVHDHLEKSGKLRPGLVGRAQRLGGEFLVGFYRWAQARGLTTSASRGDFLFDDLVTSKLPARYARNSQTMRALFDVWVDPDELARVSPVLACVKAISKASHQLLDARKIRSTEHDKHHASFASMVDVFTCDGRNQPLVARVMEAGGTGTIVLQTRSPSRVAEALTT